METSGVTRYQCDLAVIGAGLAGFAAALRAAQQGLVARVFEKLPDTRHLCNSRLTGGIFHVALDGLLDPPAVLRQRIETATDGSADPELAGAIADDALRLVRWLQAQGIRFMRSGRDPWQTFTLAPPALPQFGRRWQGRAGDVMLRVLEQRLSQSNGKVLRGHRAQELLMREGRCEGFSGVTLDGLPFAVEARAVVIADGGFQADPRELEQHISPDPSRLCQRNAQTGFGDGLRMARRAGAAAVGLSAFYGHTLSRDALHNDMLWPFPWADDLARASIVVGPDARRFVDEGRGGVYIANQLARLPDPAAACAIFDEETWQGPGRNRALSANPYMVHAGGTLHRATTLNQLAAQAGLPSQVLVAEVAAYNAALAADRLRDLCPARSVLKAPARPITRPPFYALPIVAGITYTMGGIRIDAHARALTESGLPIPGLYAAGACTGGLEGGPQAGYVGGLIKAGVTGLRAGEHATEVQASLALAREL